MPIDDLWIIFASGEISKYKLPNTIFPSRVFGFIHVAFVCCNNAISYFFKFHDGKVLMQPNRRRNGTGCILLLEADQVISFHPPVTRNLCSCT